MQQRFEFSGSGREFFKIWIVNICLSVLTLGIYTAWAKVRTKRYFYGNTSYQEHAFDYTATPIAILKGRIIAAVLLILFTLASSFSSYASIVLTILFATAFPWIICTSLRFNARVSVFRNVRFNFTGTYGDAFIAFILWPVLVPLTLGLIYPVVKKKQIHFIYNHFRYGNASIATSLDTNTLYKIYGAALLIFLLLISVISVFFLILFYSEDVFLIGLTPMVYLAIAFSFVFVMAKLANALYGSLTIDGKHKMAADLKTLQLFKIYLGYGALMGITLGLAYPWFAVALAKYKVEHTSLALDGDLDNVIDEINDTGSSSGSEVDDLFDIDSGLV